MCENIRYQGIKAVSLHYTSKLPGFENVMKVVVPHRQFKQFLEDTENEYGDLFYTEVRWLSRGIDTRAVS